MQFEDHGFQPVILGGDITAYSLARTFHEAYRVKSIVVSQVSSHLCADSCIMENIIVPGMENLETFLSKLAEIGEAHADGKLILLACGDWYVRLIVENRAELEKHYIIPYISEELLNRLVLKDSFYDLCDANDVPHPKTFVYDVNKPHSLDGLDIDFPLVAKPASSAAYHYAQFPGKRKVYFFDDRDSLENMLLNLRTSSYDHKFLLQELIPGDDTNMRILTTYSDKNGKVRFAAFGQTLLEDKKAMGIGNPVAIISRRNDEIVADATRLLEALGYTGFANFDIKVDPRTGKHYFFEINTRLGRSNYYVTASGHNVSRWMVEDLVFDNPLPEQMVIAEGDESLYTVVPKQTLMDYVTDPQLKEEVKRLYSQGKATDPIDYAVEEKFIRKIYPRIFMSKQRKAFKAAFEAARAKGKKA